MKSNKNLAKLCLISASILSLSMNSYAAKEDLKIRIKELGCGAQSSVDLYKYGDNLELVAAKEVYNITDDEFAHEVDILKQLNHKNIIKYIDSFKNDFDINCIIMEFVDGVNLEQYIKEHTNNSPLVYTADTTDIADEEIIKIMRELTDSINYVHSLGIIHRDIKPRNIMVTKDGNIKILDFGSARRSDEPSNMSYSPNKFKNLFGSLGTPPYMSPEFEEEVSEKNDMWSLGCTLYELCVGKPLFNNSSYNIFEDIDNYDDQNIPQELSNRSEIIQELFKNLMKKDSEERFSAEDALKLISDFSK